MLLSITTTHYPATDLGYLLHKHPSRFQSFSLAFGKAYVFYPQAEKHLCTAVLLLDIDPIGLVRGHKKGQNAGFSLYQYVNDRPYVASSFLSVAIAQVYGTALSGRCKNKPELVNTPIPIKVKLAVIPDASGGDLLYRLFEPLGYDVKLIGSPLDNRFPDWGESKYFTVELSKSIKLSELLTHLYVLIPVLDNFKHYWVGDAEVEKLLERGEGWLSGHPECDLITRRYLKFQRSLTQAAFMQLMADDTPDIDQQDAAFSAEEGELENTISLNEQRLNSVFSILKASSAKRVLDLGCGEGKLIKKLIQDPQFVEIAGFDVSYRVLEKAKEHLHLDRLPPKQQERIKLWHGSLNYKDKRLIGFDAAAAVEVIEHFDISRLKTFEQIIFKYAKPTTILITTPNAEYNVKFETLPVDQFRHKDHRFEWTRSEFQAWANQVSEKYGYSVKYLAIGPEEDDVGAPGQMGVFTR